MRSYLFTEMERRIVQAFLAGEKVDRLAIGKIKHRARRFRETLTSDIDLFFKLLDRL